eukprot:g11594.t1
MQILSGFELARWFREDCTGNYNINHVLSDSSTASFDHDIIIVASDSSESIVSNGGAKAKYGWDVDRLRAAEEAEESREPVETDSPDISEEDKDSDTPQPSSRANLEKEKRLDKLKNSTLNLTSMTNEP